MAEQYVEVRVDNESYAIPILEIHEIIRMQEITHIPNTRTGVLGVINLRGQIISVMSLRERLRMSDIEPTKSTRIVVMNDGESVIGIIVDSVHQVLAFDEIQSPPEQIGHVDASFLRAIGRKGESLTSILDLNRLISA